MGQRDVGPQQTSAPQLGDFAARRCRVPARAWIRQSRFAGLRPSGRDRVQFGLDDVRRGTRNRDVSGRRAPTASGGTKTVRAPESAWAASAASRCAASPEMSHQSTTVVIPASSAWSNPASVAA